MKKKFSPGVANYFRIQNSPHRETLLELRARILEVVPQAEEVVKYGMPTFVVDGVAVAGIMAHKNHIGYYPYSGAVLSQLPELVEKFGGTFSALHVPIDKPLPRTVIRKLIKTRMKQIQN